jgi:hypothetical protein
VINKPNKLIYKVPYYSQWESAHLVDKFLTNFDLAIEDPKWKNSGAKTKEEYILWAKNVCGMACLKMILRMLNDIEMPTIKMAQDSVKYDAYRVNFDENSIFGMIYVGFTEYAKQEFNLNSTFSTQLTINDIVNCLMKGNLVIASVSNKIRDEIPKVSSKGGHLVLVVGYDKIKKFLVIHNPSGYHKRSQEYHKVSFDNFNACFAERGIIISTYL